VTDLVGGTMMQKAICYKEILLVTTRRETKTNADAIFSDRFRTLKRIAVGKKRFLFLILGIALLAACSNNGGNNGGGETDPGLQPPTTSVSGTILFKGNPLADAIVTVFNTNTNPSNVFAVTTTDANGNYSIPGFPTGGDCILNYQLMASKTGYAFNPFMAANASGNRAAYLWDPAPQNWYVNTGANVTREGYNGSFSNQSGGSGIIFNVINYNSNSVANNSITSADFNAYDGSNPLVSLAATGQQTSFVSGDDASEQKGVAWPGTRYVDNSNGTITDNLTGLIWLKNAGCFTPTVWASALANVNQLASGVCGLTDGSTAGQWRLPNIVELESMVDVSASNPAVTAGTPFINVSNGIYWSSTPYFGGEAGSTNAWAIRFSDGRYINDNISNVMATSNNAVWAVKGAGGGAVQLQATGAYVPSGSGDDGTIESGLPLTSPRMLDNGNGTVTDTVTGLIWMKQADCINDTWPGAIAKVNSLASGQCGLTDGSATGSWRMPNRREMQSLADRAQNNQADYFDETFVSGTFGVSSQAAIFTNFIQSQYYWTSTTNAANTTEAWTVYSCDYGVYDISKTNTGYTLAVR
jgi:uncharacterized protein DUF1566/carboxypeptidase family protein